MMKRLALVSIVLLSAPQVLGAGTYSFADGRGSISVKERVRCGPASPHGRAFPGGGPSGVVHVDLSFGVVPAGDRLGDAEAVIGSWALRSEAAPFFHGGVTRGTLVPAKGGVRLYELYGFTNFTGTACSNEADHDTRNAVRIFGTCGNDQEIVFEISRRPLVSGKNGFNYFEESAVLARGTFRGNVTCGQTTDRNRIRVNLSRR